MALKITSRIDEPIFLSIPCFEVGMPVFRAKRCLAEVIPNALFHENDQPNFPITQRYLLRVEEEAIRLILPLL